MKSGASGGSQRPSYNYEEYYKSQKAAEIKALEADFLEKQIQIPLQEMAFGVDVILNRWSNRAVDMQSATEIKNNMLQGEKSGKHYAQDAYLYEKARIFIEKEEVEIEKLLREKKFEFDDNDEEIEVSLSEEELADCLSPAKKISYLNTLSDLAKDYFAVCLEKFSQIIAQVEQEKSVEENGDESAAEASPGISPKGKEAINTGKGNSGASAAAGKP